MECTDRDYFPGYAFESRDHVAPDHPTTEKEQKKQQRRPRSTPQKVSAPLKLPRNARVSKPDDTSRFKHLLAQHRKESLAPAKEQLARARAARANLESLAESVADIRSALAFRHSLAVAARDVRSGNENNDDDEISDGRREKAKRSLSTSLAPMRSPRLPIVNTASMSPLERRLHHSQQTIIASELTLEQQTQSNSEQLVEIRRRIACELKRSRHHLHARTTSTVLSPPGYFVVAPSSTQIVEIMQDLAARVPSDRELGPDLPCERESPMTLYKRVPLPSRVLAAPTDGEDDNLTLGLLSESCPFLHLNPRIIQLGRGPKSSTVVATVTVTGTAPRRIQLMRLNSVSAERIAVSAISTTSAAATCATATAGTAAGTFYTGQTFSIRVQLTRGAIAPLPEEAKRFGIVLAVDGIHYLWPVTIERESSRLVPASHAQLHCFSPEALVHMVRLRNTGQVAGAFTAILDGAGDGKGSNNGWVLVQPSEGHVAPGETVEVTLTCSEADVLEAGGALAANMALRVTDTDSAALIMSVPLRFQGFARPLTWSHGGLREFGPCPTTSVLRTTVEIANPNPFPVPYKLTLNQPSAAVRATLDPCQGMVPASSTAVARVALQHTSLAEMTAKRPPGTTDPFQVALSAQTPSIASATPIADMVLSGSFVVPGLVISLQHITLPDDLLAGDDFTLPLTLTNLLPVDQQCSLDWQKKGDPGDSISFSLAPQQQPGAPVLIEAGKSVTGLFVCRFATPGPIRASCRILSLAPTAPGTAAAATITIRGAVKQPILRASASRVDMPAVTLGTPASARLHLHWDVSARELAGRERHPRELAGYLVGHGRLDAPVRRLDGSETVDLDVEVLTAEGPFARMLGLTPTDPPPSHTDMQRWLHITPERGVARPGSAAAVHFTWVPRKPRVKSAAPELSPEQQQMLLQQGPGGPDSSGGAAAAPALNGTGAAAAGGGTTLTAPGTASTGQQQEKRIASGGKKRSGKSERPPLLSAGGNGSPGSGPPSPTPDGAFGNGMQSQFGSTMIPIDVDPQLTATVVYRVPIAVALLHRDAPGSRIVVDHRPDSTLGYVTVTCTMTSPMISLVGLPSPTSTPSAVAAGVVAMGGVTSSPARPTTVATADFGAHVAGAGKVHCIRVINHSPTEALDYRSLGVQVRTLAGPVSAFRQARAVRPIPPLSVGQIYLAFAAPAATTKSVECKAEIQVRAKSTTIPLRAEAIAFKPELSWTLAAGSPAVGHIAAAVDSVAAEWAWDLGHVFVGEPATLSLTVANAATHPVPGAGSIKLDSGPSSSIISVLLTAVPDLIPAGGSATVTLTVTSGISHALPYGASTSTVALLTVQGAPAPVRVSIRCTPWTHGLALLAPPGWRLLPAAAAPSSSSAPLQAPATVTASTMALSDASKKGTAAAALVTPTVGGAWEVPVTWTRAGQLGRGLAHRPVYRVTWPANALRAMHLRPPPGTAGGPAVTGATTAAAAGGGGKAGGGAAAGGGGAKDAKPLQATVVRASGGSGIAGRVAAADRMLVVQALIPQHGVAAVATGSASAAAAAAAAAASATAVVSVEAGRTAPTDILALGLQMLAAGDDPRDPVVCGTRRELADAYAAAVAAKLLLARRPSSPPAPPSVPLTGSSSAMLMSSTATVAAESKLGRPVSAAQESLAIDSVPTAETAATAADEEQPEPGVAWVSLARDVPVPVFDGASIDLSLVGGFDVETKKLVPDSAPRVWQIMLKTVVVVPK
ncbi:hypothetical protein BC828DRAFT_387551 [Blastocladiella britannica]|nr:hypothetical protein BC828DRAFT_387551 [Blastocladiella britannica]